MLENLPLIFWQNYICLLSKQELRKLLCKLSETSKYLYNISKLIKLNNKSEFPRNIYIPLNQSWIVVILIFKSSRAFKAHLDSSYSS